MHGTTGSSHDVLPLKLLDNPRLRYLSVVFVCFPDFFFTPERHLIQLARPEHEDARSGQSQPRGMLWPFQNLQGARDVDHFLLLVGGRSDL